MKYNFKVIEYGICRYLVNYTDKKVKRLVYSTCAVYDGMFKSAEPKCEIKDLPAHSYCEIEEVDRYEDGVIYFSIDIVEWEDGEIEKEMDIRHIKLWGGGVIKGELVKRNVEKISDGKNNKEDN